ncbi:hypothetical protein CR513_20823, partial [Mucuna pruriens]
MHFLYNSTPHLSSWLHTLSTLTVPKSRLLPLLNRFLSLFLSGFGVKEQWWLNLFVDKDTAACGGGLVSLLTYTAKVGKVVMVCQAASQTRFRALKHENGTAGSSTIIHAFNLSQIARLNISVICSNLSRNRFLLCSFWVKLVVFVVFLVGERIPIVRDSICDCCG